MLLFLSTDELNPPELQETVLAGLQHAYIDNYDSAMVFFQDVRNTYPDNPAGFFFSAALVQLEMMDACHYDHAEIYLGYLQQAIDKAQIILEQRDDYWARFYLGSCYTYRAVYEGLQKNYYATFTYGVKGGKILKELIEKDPSFYDAYLGAGTYEYFLARAARYLPILNLGGGDVPEAIHKIHLAATNSIYSGPTAYNSLAFIYSEEKEYARADSIIDHLLTDHPNARTFLWTKANLEMKQERFGSAAAIYRMLHDVYIELPAPNYANCAQCKLLEGTCYYKSDDPDAARDAFRTVISYKEFADRFPVINDYSREAYGLLTRIY
ncbi:tetratricopeptide repeat protein [candidate division WOR-3 bacterium]|nr:tetratricopeptide repeat protein [candidate division WOR-3 bacterium]